MNNDIFLLKFLAKKLKKIFKEVSQYILQSGILVKGPDRFRFVVQISSQAIFLLFFGSGTQGNLWVTFCTKSVCRFLYFHILVCGFYCIAHVRKCMKTSFDLDCVHTMPAHFENGRKIDSKNSFLDFDAEEKYLHTKNRPVSIQKR